jgi:tRNA 2-thiouridine synthesizing protein E
MPPTTSFADINPHTLNPVATQTLQVKGRGVLIDVEGYLMNLADWSEDFVLALAEREGLALTEQHWEVIRFIRAYYERHQVQPQVRVMIKHFAQVWGPEQGNNHYLHTLFPRGGPQKQGNRLAGIRRTRGEH